MPATQKMTNRAISGASVVEYIVMIVIIFSALYVMKESISRGVFAKYKAAGDSFAFGRQYDAKRTTVCRQDILSYNTDGTANLGPFYDEDCFHARVMRPPVPLANGRWDTANGGCPQCNPGDTGCFQCEDSIKAACHNDYCTSDSNTVKGQGGNVPDCSGKSCGDNGYGGSCGTCPTGQSCNASGQCACVPKCSGKGCGDDGCGGSCGTCPTGQSCNASGQCVANQCGPQTFTDSNGCVTRLNPGTGSQASTCAGNGCVPSSTVMYQCVGTTWERQGGLCQVACPYQTLNNNGCELSFSPQTGYPGFVTQTVGCAGGQGCSGQVTAKCSWGSWVVTNGSCQLTCPVQTVQDGGCDVMLREGSGSQVSMCTGQWCTARGRTVTATCGSGGSWSVPAGACSGN